MCNMGGINVARYSKDKKKIRNVWLMSIVRLLLIGMGITYFTMLSYGLTQIGYAQIIPAYLVTITSIFILVFSLLKAGSILFEIHTYDLLISMPISPRVIVASRFLSIYVGNAVLSLLAIIPGMIIYGMDQKPGISFYVMMSFGVFLLPLIPITIATAIGAIVIGVGSRMRHKNLAIIFFSFALTAGAIAFSIISGQSAEGMTQNDLANLSNHIADIIYQIYPPAKLFSLGVTEQNYGAYMGFAGISIGIFLLFVEIVQRLYVTICNAIHATNTKNNYVMQELKSNSIRMAFYKKEIKRYISSGVYVMNTAIGYLMLIAMSVAICFVGVEEVEKVMEIPHVLTNYLPFALAAMCCVNSTTGCSISIEGKQWWIPKTMPVPTKVILDSKIMVNLTVALPAIFISEIFVLFSVKGDLLTSLYLIGIPLVYSFFTSVLGITINLHMPMFQWESETTVVKQSGASFLVLLMNIVALVIPVVFLVITKNLNLVYSMTILIMTILTIVLYHWNNSWDLRKLD